MKKQLTNEEKSALTSTEVRLLEQYYLEKREVEVLAKEMDTSIHWISYTIEAARRKIEIVSNQPKD